MIAHKAEAQDLYVKSKYADCDVIHPGNEVLPAFENVVPFQSMTAHVIISLHTFFRMKVACAVFMTGRS